MKEIFDMKRGNALKAIVLVVCAVLLGTMLLTGCDSPAGSEPSEKQTYYVTLYNRGSSSNPASFTEGDSYTLPTATRTWYTLKGWNTAADGSGTSYSVGDKITVSSTINLYGQWTLDSASPTMTGSEYAAFCDDRNNLDSTIDLTIKISDPLPAASDLDNSSYKLNITLDLSGCTSLKNINDTYSFINLVGIVFPSEIESIYAGAFIVGCDNIASAKFSDTSKQWYRYTSGAWSTTTNKPTSNAMETTGLAVTDAAMNASKLKNSVYYWSTTKYE